VKLPEKVEIFRKFELKNRNFFNPDPRPTIFQTRLTPLIKRWFLEEWCDWRVFEE